MSAYFQPASCPGQQDLSVWDWWKANCAKLPAFTYVLRAVLTNSPNSCPPERLFSTSIQLSMTIRSRLTPTKCSYRSSQSLTNEDSSSRVTRSEGEGEEWVRGFGRLLAVCNYPFSCTFGNPSRKRHISCKESRVAVNNRPLIR